MKGVQYHSGITLMVIALGIGLLLMLAKFLAYYLTNSNAILTDALESIVNILAGGLALYSVIYASRGKDMDHPYGHGKIEFVSSAVEGILILVAGTILFGKGLYHFFYPNELSQLDIGILITLVTAIIHYFLGLKLVKRGIMTNSMAMTTSGKHLQSDAYSSFGILVGLVFIYFTDWDWVDNLMAMGFGAVIGVTGYRVLKKSMAGILDESDFKVITRWVKKLDSNRRDPWIDLHNFRIIKYGSALHVDCHLTLPWYYKLDESHEEVKLLERSIEEISDAPVELFVHSDPCTPESCPYCLVKDCPVRQHPFKKRLEWTMEKIIKDQPHQGQ